MIKQKELNAIVRETICLDAIKLCEEEIKEIKIKLEVLKKWVKIKQ